LARRKASSVSQVRYLIARYKVMRDRRARIGSNAGAFPSRLPGFRQIAQLQQLKGMDLSSIFGGGGMDPGFVAPPSPRRIPGLPPGYTPPMSPAMRAQARAMGWGNEVGGSSPSDEERRRLKEKRKRERQARKASRKKKR